MREALLQTKLYVPEIRSSRVPRPHLLARLNVGLHGRLTLVSAPASFGKSTLISEWLAVVEQPAAWLSLDKGDADISRFLTYFVASLQRIAADVGNGVLSALQSPQPLPVESLLTALINDVANIGYRDDLRRNVQ